jgi:hypothetical protein
VAPVGSADLGSEARRARSATLLPLAVRTRLHLRREYTSRERLVSEGRTLVRLQRNRFTPEDGTVTATDAVSSFLTPPAGWVVRGRNFYSTPLGRFDVMFSEASGKWVALDHWMLAEAGRVVLRPAKKKRFATRAKAVAWCMKRGRAEVSR